MTIIEVSPSVYIYQDDRYYLVNTCCVILDSKLIFIDTGLDEEAALEFISKMRSKAEKTEIELVLTHAHGDHLGGMKAFEGRKIVVSKLFCDSLNENMKKYNWDAERKKYFNSLKLEAMEEQITIGDGDNKIIFKQMGGHSPESIYGYYPKERILFAGDNLLSKMPQYFPFDNTDLHAWINGLKEWEKLEINWVVVGHGDVVTKDHITKVREFFEELVLFLERCASEKLLVEQVLSHEKCPNYFEKDPENWTAAGIEASYSRMIGE